MPPTKASLVIAAALLAACAMETEPFPGEETATFVAGEAPVDALVNGSEWSIGLHAPYDAPARASFECPIAWGCDVLVTVALPASVPAGTVVPAELRLLGGGRDDVPEQLVLTHAETAVAVRAEPVPGAETLKYTLELRVLDPVLLEDVADVEMRATVAWQDIGFFRCGGGACRVCSSSADCDAGAPCLAAGICAQPADPAPACEPCRTLASGIPDVPVAHHDELSGLGAHCYEVGVADDPNVAGERFSMRVDALGADDSAYELRLYRDAEACAQTRPLALSRPHGRTQSLAWLESAEEDGGTFLLQVIRRSGTAERAPYVVAVSPLE